MTKLNKPIIAAFDFDGTISKADTFMPFLIRACGRWRVIKALLYLAGAGINVGLGRIHRDQFKAQLIAQLFTGTALAQLQQFGIQHAQHVCATQLRPAALTRIAWHRERGHRLIMVSASLDVYLHAIAAELGFNDLLCTQLAAQDGLCLGQFVGANCRGAEKVRRLECLCGALTGYQLYAYGDSAGDRELLAAADSAEYRGFNSDQI
jgi:phosphatidylglycerophosphatase C